MPVKFATGLWVAVAALAVAGATVGASDDERKGSDELKYRGRRAKNVIFFVGDGMGVSTVTAARVLSVGVSGQLVLDQFPYTALSRTYGSDAITADSAPTMTAMMSGVNTNQAVLGLDETTEPLDFNKNGDGKAPQTLLELAKAAGMRVGVVSTAQITHATPAATYAHINNRNDENAIALQALPTAATYNSRLGKGVDVLLGGGRRFFVPSGVPDEEGVNGARADKRDLRQEYQKAGYTYVWNQAGFQALTARQLPVLGVFESGHMEYEHDRPTDLGKEPSLTDMTTMSIKLLEQASRRDQGRDGYFLMVESGRIDHAHHEGNAFRALTETQEFDEAIGAASRLVNLDETLIIVSADHSHVFNIAGYPMRPKAELPYAVTSDAGFNALAGNGILDVVYDLKTTTGHVSAPGDRNGVPYTAIGYLNGPGYRSGARQDPRTDTFPGRGGQTPNGPWHPAYFQESAVPMGSETHSGEEVAIYAVGPGAELVRGTVKNTFIFHVMKAALRLH